MKTNDITYIGKVLNNGHLSLDESVKQNLHLKEGDKIEISLKKLEDENSIVSDEKFSPEAIEYIDYLVGSGIKGKALKRVIKEIRKIDDKYQSMPRSEIIKEAYAVAEKRAQAWYQKHGLKPAQLSDCELKFKLME
ncbi:MAG TPA: hypothetical protein VGD14_11800 [bacterium]